MPKVKKTISEMTIKELQAYIRKKSKKANTILKRINKKKNISKAVQEELQTLQNKGYISKRGKIKYGFREKTKEELRHQARELDYFTGWKATDTQEIISATDRKKYNDFIRNEGFENYTFQQWRDFVETMGTMESKVQSFGYENLKQLHQEKSSKDNNIDFSSVLNDVYKESKGQGKTQEQMIDALRGALFK